LLIAVVALTAAARQGSFLDKLTFIEEPSQVAAIERVLAGEIDIDGYQVTGGAVQLLVDNNIPYNLAFAGYRGILYNIPDYFDDGRFNPLGDPIICQATQKLLDRDYMAEEFLYGNAIPMYSPVLPTSPTGTQIIVETTKTKLAFAFDEDLAFQMINDRMTELGFSKNAAGHWEDALGEIEIVGCIRVEDERLEMGDYFCDQLERAGFVCRRIYGSSGDLYNYWGGTLPGDGAWTFYTEGWGSSGISLTSVWAWAQMYTDMGVGAPPYTYMTEDWCEHEFGAGFYDAAENILVGNYATLQQRLDYFALCESRMRENPTHFWSWNNASAYMVPEGIATVHDLAAGTFIHRWVGQLLRYVDADGAPIMGGDMVVANQSFLTNAINPVDGTNWTYDLMFLRPLFDDPIFIHPHTGVPVPHFLEKADVQVVAGNPVGIFPTTVEDGWCTLEFVDSIDVPGDAWADWDAANQVFLTVDEVYPDGVTDAAHKTTLTYPDWLTDGTLKWHDGSAFSIADMVFGLIIGFPFDRAKSESAIYDSTMVSVYESGMASFRGAKIISEQPVVIEIYGSGISLYAELIANGDSAVMWPASGEAGLQPAWHNAALGMKVEAQGLAAFGQGKATELGVDWISYVDGPTLQMVLSELTTARMTNYIPYEPTLGQWVTEADAIERYQNLEEFAAKYNHVYIGTGPMMLTQVDSLASITVLENNPDYPFETGHYLGVIPDSPEIPNVSATGPSTVTIGEAAVFDVSITLGGEAYSADNIEKVVYLLIDANGTVAYNGDGVVLGDGAAQVSLTAAQTGTLASGANQLTIVVVAKTVALPGQVNLTFTTL
jgi:peptide/nickel transport system substrate-binding protein